MLIKYETGDMFASGAECLINTVNCEGYMGKGIAYQFKMKFPENNKSYVKACRNGSLRPGTLHVFVEDGITIINFPTKDRWREKSKLSYIETGLDEFLRVLPDLQVKSIAIPPLGCGNGGLQWPVVKRLIEEKLEKATSVVMVDARGLTVEQDTALRKQLREAGVDYKVYKNTMVHFAIQGTQFEGLDEYLSGPSTFAFSYEDAAAGASIINKVAKDVKELEFKAGVVEGVLYDAAGMKVIADIPSRDVLLSKLLGSFKSPMSSFARVIDQIAKKGESAAE